MAQRSMPDPHEFPSNAHTQTKVNAARDALDKERPKITAVVTGTAIKQKKSLGSRISEIFTGDDARSVGNYVVLDVIVPATKNLISDALTTAIERFFFGDGRSRRPGGAASYGQYTPYNRTTSTSRGAPPWGPEQQTRREMSPRGRATHDFREVLVGDRQEGAMVLDLLQELISMYDIATVADYYEACNVTAEFTDRQWGWTSLDGAQVVRVRDGYQIQVPPPIPLK